MLSKISFPATHFQFPSKSATKRSFDKETKKKRKKKSHHRITNQFYAIEQ